MRILRRDIGRICVVEFEDKIDVGLIISAVSYNPIKAMQVYFPNNKPDDQIIAVRAKQILELGAKFEAFIDDREFGARLVDPEDD